MCTGDHKSLQFVILLLLPNRFLNVSSQTHWTTSPTSCLDCELRTWMNTMLFFFRLLPASGVSTVNIKDLAIVLYWLLLLLLPWLEPAEPQDYKTPALTRATLPLIRRNTESKLKKKVNIDRGGLSPERPQDF